MTDSYIPTESCLLALK